MKIRESGMPPEEQWDSFFEPKAILKQLGISKSTKDIADFGSGYGTFTIPAAEIYRRKVYALDIDASMLTLVARKAREQT